MEKDRKTQIEEFTEKEKRVMEIYQKRHPAVRVDRDYFPFKCTEEWGECLQAYLMLTDRGRQKEKSKEEIKEKFGEEFADVFAFILLFAENEGIDLAEVLERKWFTRLTK